MAEYFLGLTCVLYSLSIGDFRSQSSLDNAVTTVLPFEDVGEELLFYAKGTGEASAVASLNFVPANLPSSPVTRGFVVQKVCILNKSLSF